jgi:hypothetical protein
MFIRGLSIWLLLIGVVAAFLANGQGTGTTAAPVDQENSGANQLTFLPILYNRVDTTLSTLPFGVQVYGTAYLNQLAASNARWVRVPISWNAIEPVKTTPATYDWGSTDSRVSQLTNIHGLNVILTLENNPEWAALHGEFGRKGPIKPEELPRMAAFIQAAAARYAGYGVHHWEFYNEPDPQSNPHGTQWGDHPVEYAQMLQTVYPAVKAANPKAKVLFGGIAYDFFTDDGGVFLRDFLDNVLQAGGGPFFDVMNFHFYPAFGWGGEMGGPGLYEKTQHLREKLASHGISKPFMITEAGWHSNNHPLLPSSPEIQNRYVVAIFAQSYAADVDVTIWWMLHDASGSYEFDTGLIRHDGVGTKKQSFYVYQHMVEQMRFAHYIRRLSTAETGSPRLEAHLFDDYTRNRRLYIAWRNPITSNTAEILRIPAHTAVVYDIFGNSQIVTDSQDGVVDGHITLTINGRPIYIETAR